jgi:hypothetical protein
VKTGDLKELLRVRYSQVSPGNGPRYVLGFEVRNQAGFGGYNGPRLRTCDLIVMDTWESGPLRLIGHELKVTRSDWVREMADPDKSAAFIETVAEWWLVVADRKIVRDGELPEGWGLLAAAGSQLRAVVQPTRKPQPPISTGLVAAWSRAVQGLGRAELEKARKPKPHTIKTMPMSGTHEFAPYGHWDGRGDVRPARNDLRARVNR